MNGNNGLTNFNTNSNASSTGTLSPLNSLNSYHKVTQLTNTASVIVNAYSNSNSNGASHNQNSHNQSSLNLSSNGSINANTYSINGILGIEDKHKLHQQTNTKTNRSKRKIVYEGKL